MQEESRRPATDSPKAKGQANQPGSFSEREEQHKGKTQRKRKWLDLILARK
jgi:hypothetical protein